MDLEFASLVIDFHKISVFVHEGGRERLLLLRPLELLRSSFVSALEYQRWIVRRKYPQLQICRGETILSYNECLQESKRERLFLNLLFLAFE